jgi:hypothetical protein
MTDAQTLPRVGEFALGVATAGHGAMDLPNQGIKNSSPISARPISAIRPAMPGRPMTRQT